LPNQFEQSPNDQHRVLNCAQAEIRQTNYENQEINDSIESIDPVEV